MSSAEFAQRMVKVKNLSKGNKFETISLSEFNLQQGLYKHINASHCWSQLANDMSFPPVSRFKQHSPRK